MRTVRNGRALVVVAVVVVALAIALGVTMRGVTAVGGTRTEGYAIPLQGASAARVELTMDSGELSIGRGASRLLDGSFTFNVDEWTPEIAYQVISREGVLAIEQGRLDGPFPVVYGDKVNTWDVALTPNIPIDLRVDLGSADASVSLGGLDLLGAKVAGDGGDVEIDFGATLPRDLDASVTTGGGDATLSLPADVGVRVVASGGEVQAEGLRATGSAYVNELYGTTPVTLTLTVDTDGGEVTLRQHSLLAPVPSPITEPTV